MMWHRLAPTFNTVTDIWFVAGLALGTIVTGFCAIGSFARGGDSVRRKSWTLEHGARKRAFLASRVALRARGRRGAGLDR
jgi:hypothetical protein